MKIRSSGILLPIQSLPSAYGIGDLGPETDRFSDFLREAGQQVWQILPVNPTLAKHGHSPYHSPSAFACNPLLISPEQMTEDGFLQKADLEDLPIFSSDRIDYESALEARQRLFKKAFFRALPKKDPLFEQFCEQNAWWLDDYALFTAIAERLKTTRWHRWPDPLRKRDPSALNTAADKLSETIDFIRFVQYVFDIQWHAFKKRAEEKKIRILGDLPIYVPHDSADVWAAPQLFKLDRSMRPRVVSGVPPDYFSETGQRWGHPLYRWEIHRETGFDWWVRRIRRNMALFDYLRIDHFRGLVAYWEIPAAEETAENGRWKKAPARALLNTLYRSMPGLALIAEDLGHITADVRETARDYDIPGMRVLVFGFGDHPGDNPNAIHNVDRNCVCYTGTHDTNTAAGWFLDEAGKLGRKRVFTYFGRNLTAQEFAWELIRLAMMSRAWLSILPMQDILALGADARINRPSSQAGNWQWRLSAEQIESETASRLYRMTEIFGRT